jgi:two-component system NarL family response regulator
MLVDDHPLFMEGFKYLLETYGIEVSGTAGCGLEAIDKACTLHPDIILMDIKMSDISGIDVLRMIKAKMPDIRIVMLTSSEEDEDLFDAVRYGASGYLLKGTNGSELVEMLHDLENGEIPLSPGLASRLLEEFRHQDNGRQQGVLLSQVQSPSVQLTQRQLEILEMVARGVTYKEAGEALGLTERTLKYHMGRIITLLHLENRSQAIAYAVRMGIVKDGETGIR